MIAQQYQRMHRYEGKRFRVGELSAALKALALAQGCGEDDALYSYSQRLADGTMAKGYSLSAASFEDVCEVTEFLVIGVFGQASSQCPVMRLSLAANTAVGEFTAPTPITLDTFIEAAERSLRLERSPEDNELFEHEMDFDESNLDAEFQEQRFRRLEDVVYGRSQLRCFLSYRFYPSTESAALQLSQFLTALNVEVVSGVQYQPRKVSEKVTELIDGNLDFVVLLVGANGESFWTRDEIARAWGRGIAVVPIVEATAKFESGLFGDLEYIPFAKGHIGDAFLKLLQAVLFFRKQKAARLDRPFADLRDEDIPF